MVFLFEYGYPLILRGEDLHLRRLKKATIVSLFNVLSRDPKFGVLRNGLPPR